jgi:hypothetical protein
MELKSLPLIGVYQLDVEQLNTQRAQAKLIHGSGDTRAAGDQVEQPVRKIVTSRLPRRCRITHGHVIDVSEMVSPQVDIIISDGIRSGHLFQAEDGTEYVPYESVYAIGEVKTTYYKSKKYIQAFSASIANIKKMRRTPTGRNPLFGFIFFVDSNDFQVADIEEFYTQSRIEDLPNVVCFLDRGVIFHGAFLRDGEGRPIVTQYHLYPKLDAKAGVENYWTYLNWGLDNHAQNLMFLHVILSQHIDSCDLEAPNLAHYLLRYLGPWKESTLFKP